MAAAVQGFLIEGRLYGSPLGFSERWQRFLDHLVGEGWWVFGPWAETETEGPLTGIPLPYARRYRVILWREGATEAEAREAVERAEKASGSAVDGWFEWFREVRELVVQPTLVEIGEVTREAGRQARRAAGWLPLVAVVAGLWAVARLVKT